jgi:hypothetical protein
VTDNSSSDYCKGAVSAIGAACQLGGTAGRPILGVANLCPRFFTLDEDTRLITLVHEITHALVGGPGTAT